MFIPLAVHASIAARTVCGCKTKRAQRIGKMKRTQETTKYVVFDMPFFYMSSIMKNYTRARMYQRLRHGTNIYTILSETHIHPRWPSRPVPPYRIIDAMALLRQIQVFTLSGGLAKLVAVHPHDTRRVFLPNGVVHRSRQIVQWTTCTRSTLWTCDFSRHVKQIFYTRLVLSPTGTFLLKPSSSCSL